MSGAAAIEVDRLYKRFGTFTAVDGISFRVMPGEIFGFLGPNGAGKTTTIRILLGLLAPSGGEVRVLGCDVARQAKRVHARLGYMSQLFTLYGDLTVAENLSFYGRAYGLSGPRLRQRQETIIAMAGLEGRENELASNLSGGWRQRLALGCAILHEPEVLFLDEPTAGVDPVSRRLFWDLIYDLAASGTTVFVTTHYMDEAEQCRRLAFMSLGRLVAEGTPEELKSAAMPGQVLEIDCSPPEVALAALQRAQLSGRLPLEEVALYGSLIHAIAPDADAARAGIARILADADVSLRRVEPIPPSLEDVFIARVRQAARSRAVSA